MATQGVPLWSKAAASNATADPAAPFPEGMAPSAVNDGVRGLMASVAKWRDDLYGLTTAGTSTAYTVTTNATYATTAAMSGAVFTIIPNATSGAAPTLAVDGLTAYALNISTGVAVPTGYFKSGTPYKVKYVHATTEFIVLNAPAVLPANLVTTAAIADNAVTLAKIATIADNRLLGNVSGGSAVPAELTIGAGLSVSGTTLLSAFPPAGSFKNLSIKVASNTTVTVAADFVTTTDGSTFQTTAVSSTINLGTTGVDALDTGTVAAATWYAVWVIVKADGTTKCLASTSATSPTMPSGYTYKARVGWVRTAPAAAQLLGTWQLGREAQYVVGLAQTSIAPLVSNGTVGTYSATSPTLVDAAVGWFVPPTASKIFLIGTTNHNNAGQSSILVAPNTSWGGSNRGPSGTANHGWPLYLNAAVGVFTQRVDLLLESTNVAFASGGPGGAISALGWEDNI